MHAIMILFIELHVPSILMFIITHI